MDSTIHRLFYGVPEDAAYAATPEELDTEDIPPERIEGLKELARAKNRELSIHAARLLCSWGDKLGFEVLHDFVLNEPPVDRQWLPHRIWGYDDTYRHIAYALGRYWATHQENGDGDAARAAIVPVYIRLLEYSLVLPFEVPLDFLMRYEFIEFLPTLKSLLVGLLANPTAPDGKIEDLARVMMPYERDFVLECLAKHGRSAPSSHS